MIWLFVGVAIGVIWTLATVYVCYRVYKFAHMKGFAAGGKTMHGLIQSNVQAELAKQRELVNNATANAHRKDLQA